MKGIIIKGIGGFYYIKDDNGTVTECRARGKFRKDNKKPTVGDIVEFDSGCILDIYKRRSYLIRPSVANVDNLIIVISTKNPNPDLFLVDKLIVASKKSNIKPIICINKTDLAKFEDVEKIYKNAGYDVIIMSAKEKTGIGQMKDVIKNKVSAFAGLSGVGKSSILNLLCGEVAKTGDISKINRGKHTTRHTELFEIDENTYILDTPGFSSLEINDICNVTSQELKDYFDEFENYNDQCRFKGCSHINEPDCKVKDALNEGKISLSRYNNYKELYTYLNSLNKW